MSAIFKREFKAYFITPLGYALIGGFLLIAGTLFWLFNLAMANSSLTGVLQWSVLVFILLIPLLTMRLIAEERATKTDQLLLTSPVSVGGIVCGKFFAALCVFLIMLASTLLYFPVIIKHGSPEWSLTLAQYIGFFLLGAAFIALGIFVSSVTENQIVAAFATFGIMLLMLLLNWCSSLVSGVVKTVFTYLSFFAFQANFLDGKISIVDVVYYLSMTALFLFLAARNIQRRRWN